MTHLPAVSLIIPAHNQEKYIGRCIRSSINQTLARDDYEIIVVDDGSTDRTRYALELFESEIRLIASPERQGLPASLNRGIKAARGQFVVRLDADDYVHAEYLNILSLFLRMNPDFDAVACDYLMVDDSEDVTARKDCSADPIGCGIMFRMEQLVDVGLYDEDFLSREDEDLRLRFERKHKVHRIPLPLYRYRRHDANMTNDADTMAHYADQLTRKHGEPADFGY